MGVTVTVPVSSVFATVPSTAKPTTVTHTYVGPRTPMQWGPVQVTIVVHGTKIITITATVPTERVRSAVINRGALPLLAKEVLKAQNAKVDVITGATLTSQAYVQSLQGAMKEAHLKTVSRVYRRQRHH